MELSVVMPVYNEEATVERAVGEHVRVLERLKQCDWEILCVDDASIDASADILERLSRADSRVRLLRHRENRGIYESFDDLFRNARGTYIYMTASDGQWPAENLERMFPLLGKGADLIVGVRQNRSEVYGLKRQAISYAYNFLPRLLFGVKTADAGSVKLGRSEIFRLNLISRSPFAEAERIIRAREYGYRVEFVPIRFQPRGGGKENGAKWSNIKGSLRDLYRCWQVYGSQRTEVAKQE
jgi:polyisoprenyl-phosphate glycosyltransferase